jgi:hypothetical protein
MPPRFNIDLTSSENAPLVSYVKLLVLLVFLLLNHGIFNTQPRVTNCYCALFVILALHSLCMNNLIHVDYLH